MSTLKEISEGKINVFIKPKVSIGQSLVKNSAAFSMLGLCIYLSQGSTWWTLATGTMFIFLMWCKLSNLVTNSSNVFDDVDGAIKYLTDIKAQQGE